MDCGEEFDEGFDEGFDEELRKQNGGCLF